MTGAIVKLEQIPDWPGLIPQIEHIFFSSSRTRAFRDEGERAAFKERWLGRYLTHDLPHFHVALEHAPTRQLTVWGYLAGSLDNPAHAQRFDDIGYFKQRFTHACAAYPAHLHINTLAAQRGQGVGRRLITAFATHARTNGAPGMHIVTGAGARNVGFYQRNGFGIVATALWNDAPLVFMGHPLEGRDLT